VVLFVRERVPSVAVVVVAAVVVANEIGCLVDFVAERQTMIVSFL
jgi:hypothetical protein